MASCRSAGCQAPGGVLALRRTCAGDQTRFDRSHAEHGFSRACGVIGGDGRDAADRF